VIRPSFAARCALAAAGIALLAGATTVDAAKTTNGSGGGKHTSGGTYTGSFSLVLLNSSDGLPHWGQQVTFNATSNAPYYFVELDCSQNGTVVFQQSAGFYPGYPWSQVYTLKSAAWTGGAASCNATLYSANSDGSNRQNMSAMAFQVYA
jgi:hypothetical protein